MNFPGTSLRAAYRVVVRRRSVTALAVGMLALGIGCATASFSVLDAVVLRTLPYRDPGALVTIWQTFPHWRGQPGLDATWNRIALSYQEYQDVAELRDDFRETGAAYWRDEVRLTGAGDPVSVAVALGSPSLLPLLGFQTAIGRWFLPGEQGPSAPQVAVLPYRLWIDRFGGRSSAIGQTLDLDGRPFAIVGVLPPDFPFMSLSPYARAADRDAIWTPIGSRPNDLTAHSQNYEVVAHLQPGISLEHARQDAAIAIREGRSPAQHDATVLPRQTAEVGNVTPPLTALMAAVLALVIVTCGNLAALVLGDGANRASEIRTRLAVGARTFDIVTQLVMEGALVATAGSVFGLGFAAALTKGLLSLAPFHLPHAEQVAINGDVLAAALVIAFGATLAVGLIPALMTAQDGQTSLLASRTTTRHRSRLQGALLVAQIALSTVLLLASGLLDRTLAFEGETPPGFATARRLAITLNVSSADVNRSGTGGPQAFYDELTTRLAALPGVKHVTTTSNLPIGGSGGQWAFEPNPARRLSLTSPSVQHDEVLPGYFASMGIPLLAGRPLEDSDRAGTPLVAVVNETMARTFWPTERAIDKQFLAPNGGVRTIVGVVADIRERGLGRAPVPTFYESVRQVPTSGQTVILESAEAPSALLGEVRPAIAALAPELPIGAVASLDQVLHDSLAPERFRAALLAIFACLAALMTAIGIGGVAMRAVRTNAVNSVFAWPSEPRPIRPSDS